MAVEETGWGLEFEIDAGRAKITYEVHRSAAHCAQWRVMLAFVCEGQYPRRSETLRLRNRNRKRPDFLVLESRGRVRCWRVMIFCVVGVNCYSELSGETATGVETSFGTICGRTCADPELGLRMRGWTVGRRECALLGSIFRGQNDTNEGVRVDGTTVYGSSSVSEELLERSQLLCAERMMGADWHVFF